MTTQIIEQPKDLAAEEEVRTLAVPAQDTGETVPYGLVKQVGPGEMEDIAEIATGMPAYWKGAGLLVSVGRLLMALYGRLSGPGMTDRDRRERKLSLEEAQRYGRMEHDTVLRL